MSNIFDVHSSYARLSGMGLDAPLSYLTYGAAQYDQGSPRYNWWQRSAILRDHHLIRFDWRVDVPPLDAFWTLLAAPKQPQLPLPTWLAALFLIQVDDPAPLEHRCMFHWVATAVHSIITRASSRRNDRHRTSIASVTTDRVVSYVVDAILTENPLVPWPERNDEAVRTLIALTEHLWSFPPALVRALVDQTLAERTRDSLPTVMSNDDETWLEKDIPHRLMPLDHFRRLSTLRTWDRSLPTIRGLRLGVSPQSFPFAWEQALIFMHPDAPLISDERLAWLCHHTIGHYHDTLLAESLNLDERVMDVRTTPDMCMNHVRTFHRQAQDGLEVALGQWEWFVAENLPVFQVLGFQVVRIVAVPHGLWVRLIPRSGGWGHVVWWNPQIDLPVGLLFPLNIIPSGLAAWSLHVMLWELWRDLVVTGQPAWK